MDVWNTQTKNIMFTHGWNFGSHLMPLTDNANEYLIKKKKTSLIFRSNSIKITKKKNSTKFAAKNFDCGIRWIIKLHYCDCSSYIIKISILKCIYNIIISNTMYVLRSHKIRHTTPKLNMDKNGETSKTSIRLDLSISII